MPVSTVLIQQPSIDFGTFLNASRQLLGYSPSAQVDNSRVDHSDAARFISCLAAMRDEHAPAGLTPNLLCHVSFSVLIAAEERDLMDIIQAASSMPLVVTETRARGIMAAVVTGTLAQWRDAVVAGATQDAEHNVRACFCQIKNLFESVGLSVWRDFNIKPSNDQLFYLEDKRK